MTVTLLVPYATYQAGSIVSLTDPTETALITQGLALKYPQVLAPIDPNSVISTSCKFFYPWVRDQSINVVNKGPNAGDGIKTGTAATVQTGGYFVSVAGTYGAGGTGRYFLAPANSSHFNPALESLILHIGFNKAAPGGSENFCGTQINSSTSGVLLTAGSSGTVTVNYKPGTVQNVFTAIPGMIDGTDHSITLVIDRLTKTAFLYADSILFQTKNNIDYTGSASALTTFVFGGYSGIPAAYSAQFYNCHLYAIQKDVADINIQACVDKLTLLRQALTVTNLGV